MKNITTHESNQKATDGTVTCSNKNPMINTPLLQPTDSSN